jgi:LexA-binding, inner membrane-associated putative hydrolase
MYFFFHLAVGIILGLLAADLFDDGRWLVPCAAGAILPDLIDKPLGILLPQVYFGYGRVFFHTLPVLVLVLVAGVILWIYRRSPLLLGLAAGILSHQVLDAMWSEPAGWFFPFLGTPRSWQTSPNRDIVLLLRNNLMNPSEWIIAGLLFTGLLLWLKRDRILAFAREHGRGLGVTLEIGGILLLATSGILLASGAIRKILAPHSRFGISGSLISGFTIALVAFLLWRWGSRLEAGGRARGRPGET